jgi:hypothetical protein
MVTNYLRNIYDQNWGSAMPLKLIETATTGFISVLEDEFTETEVNLVT